MGGRYFAAPNPTKNRRTYRMATIENCDICVQASKWLWVGRKSAGFPRKLSKNLLDVRGEALLPVGHPLRFQNRQRTELE